MASRAFDYIKQKGMVPFSSPLMRALLILESLNCPIYKVASFELTDIPLLKKIARTGKPIIMSTGMATLGEIEESLLAIRSESDAQVVLLKCTSTYPADPSNSNIKTIPHLREWSKTLVGLSDHTMGSAVAVAATVMGSVVIEKHLTLQRSDGGVDAGFSLEPAEFARMVSDVKQAHQALGDVSYGGSKAEQKSKLYRRSVYFKKSVSEGQKITIDDLCIIRPANGLAPKYRDQLIGRIAAHDITRGTATAWHLFRK
nr:N-acetylneuraminate synthase family protein [Aliamphritea spongicola]